MYGTYWIRSRLRVTRVIRHLRRIIVTVCDRTDPETPAVLAATVVPEAEFAFGPGRRSTTRSDDEASTYSSSISGQVQLLPRAEATTTPSQRPCGSAPAQGEDSGCYIQARTPGWHALGRARRNVRASDRGLLVLLLRNSNPRLCICPQPVYRAALLTRTHSCCSAKWLTSKSASDKRATRSC